MTSPNPYPRTTLHGIDQSGVSKTLPPTYNQGSMFYCGDVMGLQIADCDLAGFFPFVYLPFLYDFSVLGGAIGAIPIPGAYVPAGFIVLDGLIDIITSIANASSAGGTIALTAQTTGDLVAAAGTASWAAGQINVIPANSAGSCIKCTAQRQITVNVANHALTGGKFRGYLRLVPSTLT